MTLSDPISHSHGVGQGLWEGTLALARETRGHSGTTFPESLTWWVLPVPTGNYEVSIKFNDEHIPESPYLVPVIAPSDDARRLTVLSLQVRHKETSISLATVQPVRPWTPEAPSISDCARGPSTFWPRMLPGVGDLSCSRVAFRTWDRWGEQKAATVSKTPQHLQTSLFSKYSLQRNKEGLLIIGQGLRRAFKTKQTQN